MRNVGKFLLPWAKKGAKALAPHAKKFAISTAKDILEGEKSVKSILKNRGVEAIKEVGQRVANSQQGRGIRNRSLTKKMMLQRLGLGQNKKVYKKKSKKNVSKKRVKRKAVKRRGKSIQVGGRKKRKSKKKKGKSKRRRKGRNLSTKNSIFD